ncbi:MAG TPA: HigA family addiction module antitoxin [Gammaproteobacteria bacterium]|nr:HigA family addiction module antitoxin [Gammaproteobacteria bacterium]
MSSLRAKSRKPTHPGETLREDVLPALGLTQGELAKHLRVSRRTISEILHERRPLTPDMALRLAHFLGTTPESWLNMQQALDLWELEKKYASVYKAVERAASQVDAR